MAILQLGTSYHDYTYHLYYQHATGELRDLELNNYEWVPASNTNVGLPASIKNGTPLAVASYELPQSPPTVYIPSAYIETGLTLCSIIYSISTPPVYYKKQLTLTALETGIEDHSELSVSRRL